MLPTKLRLLGKRWTVKLQSPKGGKDAGECDHITATISVSPKQTEDSRRDTLLHEVTHAVDEELQLRMSERQVRLLATGLLEAFRSNPALVAYLTGE